MTTLALKGPETFPGIGFNVFLNSSGNGGSPRRGAGGWGPRAAVVKDGILPARVQTSLRGQSRGPCRGVGTCREEERCRSASSIQKRGLILSVSPFMRCEVTDSCGSRYGTDANSTLNLPLIVSHSEHSCLHLRPGGEHTPSVAQPDRKEDFYATNFQGPENSFSLSLRRRKRSRMSLGQIK